MRVQVFTVVPEALLGLNFALGLDFSEGQAHKEETVNDDGGCISKCPTWALDRLFRYVFHFGLRL